MLIEEDVEVPDQMIALLPCTLRGSSIAPALPGEHRLTDMDASVVDDVRLEDLIPRSFEDEGDTVAKEVVAHVP